MEPRDRIVSLLGALAFLGLAGSEAPIRPITAGERSGIQRPRQALARTEAEWQALWREHGSSQPIPELDFAEVMAVGIFLGTRPTGGYGVQVTKLRPEGEALVVEYAERTPGPDAMVTQALTSPFQIVSVPKHAGELRFEPVGSPARRRRGVEK